MRPCVNAEGVAKAPAPHAMMGRGADTAHQRSPGFLAKADNRNVPKAMPPCASGQFRTGKVLD